MHTSAMRLYCVVLCCVVICVCEGGMIGRGVVFTEAFHVK